MDNFVQMMKDWRRMCKMFTTDDDESCCVGCPIMALEIDVHCYNAIFSEWADKVDWEEVEDVIEVWAEEHPELVYPTWREWLETQYFQTRKKVEGGHEPLNAWMNSTHIPADIAEKLGIEPKEG